MADTETTVATPPAREIRTHHRAAEDAREAAAAQHAATVSLFSSPDTEAPTVGRYVLQRRLGAGGTGVVFAAYDPRLERSLAVKILHARKGRSTPEDVPDKQLLQEAQHTAKLVHPAVVKIFDAGLHEGQVFVAMELIEGQSMSEWLRSRPPWRHSAAVLALAARGLEAAHRRNIIHRDFKPANVLLGWNGRVCVADFGLARGIADATAGETPATRSGEVAGTPAYMAPEQYLGTGQDERSDQFSFCVSLYEALVGRKPFAGDTFADRRDAVLTAEPAPLRLHDVPDVLVRAISQGLSKNRRDRLANMGELAAILESLSMDVDLSRAFRDEALRSGALQAPMYDQYARDLPLGLATTPETIVSRRFAQIALAQRPLLYPPSELVPIIANMSSERSIPAVHARAILCAIYDEHFRSIDTWIPFVAQVSRTAVRLLFAGFAVSSITSAHYIDSIAAVYNNLVKGERVMAVDKSEASATLLVDHRSQPMNEVIRVVVTEFVRAAMLASGCRVVEITALLRAQSSFQLEASWR